MEKIYNLFAFIDDGISYSRIGCRAHTVEIDSDDEKYHYLNSKIDRDISQCSVHTLIDPIEKKEDGAFRRYYGESKLIMILFKEFDLPSNALYIFTPVVKGKPTIDIIITADDRSLEKRRELAGIKGDQIDWLTHYHKDGVMDVSALIEDDFYKAIKMTFQSELYLSSMKLLLSCIDTLAYIEFGNSDEGNVFIKWLEEYADLTSIQITAQELWELRNGILHMSNLNSKKVNKQKVRRISFYIDSSADSFYFYEQNIHYFNFKRLIEVHAEAIALWIASYNGNSKKILLFIERYDEILSDSRMMYRNR